MDSARHPWRRDGAIAIALFALPCAMALVVVRRHHHLDGGTVAILVSVSLGLPSLWLMWTTYRGPRRADILLSLGQVADQLAVAVGAQWNAEAAMRRLNDPYPLPVSWTAADPSLTDTWGSIVKLAASGAGWPPPPSEGTWAAGPGDLAGEGGELADVLARVPTGRLVVLGEPGAGKTMLMVRLVLDLLARRIPGGPVPFLASLASWDPVTQDLRSWLGTQLLIDHPALANPPPTGRTEPTQAAALLASGLILPVLDGLDEIPKEVRGRAVSRINDALRPGEQVIMTCRTKQYRDAIRPPRGVEVTLRAAAAVQLRLLDADAIRNYLCDDAAGPVTRARWAPVLAVLGTEAPAGRALRTPLMVGLARAIYNVRPGELVGTLRDPAELRMTALADRTAVESQLFDAFIPAAYRHDPDGRWKPQNAERWLVFLARHLEYKICGPDLAWWQLRMALPVVGVPVGVLVGLPLAVIIWLAGGTFLAGAVAGTTVGVIFGVTWAGLRGPGWMLLLALALVLTGNPLLLGIGVRVGIRARAKIHSTDWRPIQRGNVLGLSSAASPQAAFARQRRTGIARGAILGVVSAAIAVDGFWSRGIATGVVTGVVTGVWLGVIGGSAFSAWPYYALTRAWLALRRQLPWHLMDFLADAHRRGVLRQAGAVYQFRHIELQHRLANRDARRDPPLCPGLIHRSIVGFSSMGANLPKNVAARRSARNRFR